MSEHDANTERSGFDRRAALKKAAAAGAVAWTVPLILSETAHAQPGVCTPKCLPTTLTLSGQTLTKLCPGAAGGARPTLRSRFTATVSATCPCGGTSSGGSVVDVQNMVPAANGGQFTFTTTTTVSCTDRSGDACTRTATVTYSYRVDNNVAGLCATATLTLLSSSVA